MSRFDSSNTYLSVLGGRHKDAILSFRSVSSEQNDFLANDSLEYARLNLGVTHLLFRKDGDGLIAFMTLGMGAIKIPKSATFHGKRVKEYLKDFPVSFPALKIGQLATREGEEGKGAGTMLIEFAFQIASQESMGCAFIIADALPGKAAWYEKRGFRSYITITEGRETIPMYMELPEKA